MLPSHAVAGSDIPAALRPVVYESFSRDAGSASTIRSNGCVVVAQRVRACFGHHGARFDDSGKLSLTLHLKAWGRGNLLQSVRTVTPVITDSGARYVHKRLTEWWKILPIGFEEGFTLTKRPSGRGILKLVLAANKSPRRIQDTLDFGRLRYGDLVVTDAAGKVVPSSLSTKGNFIHIDVDDAHAVYPLTIDPVVRLEQDVSANDGTPNDAFSWSVAVSGKTALIGAPALTVNGRPYQGAAYIFSESNGSWHQVAKLTPSDGAAYVEFGVAVALSGNTALIGEVGPMEQANTEGPGAAYVFANTNGSWQQVAKLTGSDEAVNDGFGTVVALSGDIAIVGASSATVNGHTSAGSAYVFSGSNGIWAQAAKLTASNVFPGQTAAGFGSAVAISGTTAIVGAPLAYDGTTFAGAVYVFNASNGAWPQTAKLAESNESMDEFGYAVALADATALVGAPDAGTASQGAVYAFSETGGIWSQTANITASDTKSGDEFGNSLALSGATALIGASYADVGNVGEAGKAYEFHELSGIWSQVSKFTGDKSYTTWFGNKVALSGTTALVGAIYGTECFCQSGPGIARFFNEANLGIATNDPKSVHQDQNYISQTIITNAATATSPAVAVSVTVPASAAFVSATSTQGECSEGAAQVTCMVGQLPGNGGTATASVTFKAIGNTGATIDNAAGIFKATPALTVSAPTTITAKVGQGGSGNHSSNSGGGVTGLLALFALVSLLIFSMYEQHNSET